MDLPDAAREAHVRAATTSDQALCDLVLRLVARLRTGADLAPRDDIVRAAFSGDEHPDRRDVLAPGTAVGRYRIIRRLGRGGMATVYEAERADGVYEQRVALKLLRKGLDTEDLVRRFRTERQILSSLSHPNIGRLLDGGSTPEGRPFLVMELVTGSPITRWADEQRLDVAARLRLFLAVADAVHAAHRQLVVHRDIKPSNIMVDAEGRVKLLDFGIAKLLDSPAEQTDVGSRPLTPEYASPEQVAGRAITTATDVYQLGLLLRELLTGLRPLATDTSPDEPPLRLSRAVALDARVAGTPDERAGRRGTTPARLERLLRGDLDVIVGKALRPEPEQRYASADEMAGDVRRHLRGLPITAHPESARYRARKFMARHPMVLPLAAIAALAVAAYLATLVRYTHRLERQRDLAEAASRRAQETQSFFVSLLRSADPYSPADPERGRSITVVQALELGADRVRTELDGQPELRAALLSNIGEVLLSLDQIASARQVVDEVIALRTRRGDTTSTAFADDLGELGLLLNSADLYDSAKVVVNRRIRLERARRPPEPERLSDALQDLTTLEIGVDPAPSVSAAEEAVRILRPVGGAPLARALRSLADAYREDNRLADSEQAAREALALYEQVEGPTSANTGWAAHILGQTLGARGQIEEAATLIRRSIRIFDERLGPDHAATIAMRNNLAVLLIAGESYAEAEGLLREVLRAREREHGHDHTLVAGAYQNLAVAVAGQGRYRDAESLTREAEMIYRRTMPAGSYIVALPMLTRAGIQLDGGDAVGAARSAAGAAALLKGKMPPDSPPAIMADCRLGRARALLGDREGARLLLESAVRRMQTAEGVRDSHRAECETALAHLGAKGAGAP